MLLLLAVVAVAAQVRTTITTSPRAHHVQAVPSWSVVSQPESLVWRADAGAAPLSSVSDTLALALGVASPTVRACFIKKGLSEFVLLFLAASRT